MKITICCNMDKSYKHNVKQKKTEIKALVDRGITDY